MFDHNNNKDIHHASGTVMGGPWQLRHRPAEGVAVKDVVKAALGALQQVDAQMSNYRDDSDLMRLNAAPLDEFIPVPADMHKVMARALSYAQTSDGAINIALGKLVNRWGFGPDAAPKTRPDQAGLIAQTAQAALGSFALRADPPAVFKLADIAFDLCSLAKGFAVDQAAKAVEALGVQDYLIEAAGEIYAAGRAANGKAWKVGLELPVPSAERIIFDEITLDGRAVATTGGYRNRRQIDGQDVSHTINPVTGAPLVSDLLSVTVLHATCMDADALATVLYVLGPEMGPKFADDNDVAALFLIREPGGLREIRSEMFATMTPD